MASRREFLQAGIAALALPISAQAVLSPVAAASESALPVTPSYKPLYKVVFDERFPASAAFGVEARILGLPTHSIRGDITDLWFHDLDARWKKQPIAVAGLTAQGPLFCLERLAWDHGMRVVFRGDHRYLPGGAIEHTLTGPEGVLCQAALLESDADGWAARIAGIVARLPEGPSSPAKVSVRGRAKAPAQAEPEELISWVIAPVAGARVIRKA
ncbi:MAG TPA: hypothetical protein VHX36_10950 [Candidatus Acidoferrales bacterium]|jgi:hypothetical protein|nr:hypothetical protein [Candidatus Acidoferrales bacterium]